MNEPTSEVGSPPINYSESENSKWHNLFELQNKNFAELLSLMKNNENSNNSEQSVVLPKFKPEATNVNATAWCTTADYILAQNPVEGSALIVLLSKCLQGSAAQWLSTICFPGIKWNEFKELFLQRYGESQTPAAVVLNLLNSQPQANESLSVYGSRLVTTLASTWKNMSTEEIAVSVVLAHAARYDTRLQRSAFTTNISSRAELQRELNAFAYKKTDCYTDSQQEHYESKRIKMTTGLKCHFCGKIGHKIADCKTRQRGQQKITLDSTRSAGNKDKTCFKCGNLGHFASACNKQKTFGHAEKKDHNEKRVDMCIPVEPRGRMEQSGESFPFYFDSGAECSLVKEKLSSKFSGKRIYSTVILRGLGDNTICSSLQILSIVKINNYTLEILLHVVQDSYLKYEVMVGREILAQGFGFIVTQDKFEMFIDKKINLCSSLPASRFDIQEVNTELTDCYKKLLIDILLKYKERFIEGTPTSRVNTGMFSIRLHDPNKTVQRRPYRLSDEERAIVRKKISELLEANIIRSSCSPFSSPILLVKKKNGDDRLCVDYRELNANTISDKYPLPLISDQIGRLRGAKYFICLDMASGFHQIPVHSDSIERTAFVTPDGQFEYLCMPFGLKNAPSVFQRAVMNALGELAHSYVIVYMDDIMVTSSTVEEGLDRLDEVLGVLVKAGFSFNIKKCSFLKTSVEYLGYLIEAGKLRPNPRKIKAITELPPPQTTSQLRQFIGLSSYFRQFIHKFSQIMQPLYLLLTAHNFTWKEAHEKVRQKIISVLTKEPILVIFDPQYPIEVHTDASAIGYGAILLHKINNKPHVVEYYSKRTTKTESNYHSYELETLAVVNAVKHFRHYLHGRKFVILTDCNALKATSTKLELSPRVHRWWAYLQAFEFDIQYRDGKRMAHVDFLSRNPVSVKTPSFCVKEKRVQLAEITPDWLLAEQQRDKELSELKNKLSNGELAQDIETSYEIRKGVLHRKIQRNGKTFCLPIVPRAFRWSIINNIHESIMHLGSEKTLDKLYEHYWFEKMSKYVRTFVRNCITCNLSKTHSGKIPVQLHPIPKSAIPWHTVHVDVTGKLSGKNDIKEYVIVFIDAFTKYVLLHHTLNVDSKNCIKALQSAVFLFGTPYRVIADQGRCFSSKEFCDFCQSKNIKLHLIATGASRANGQVERVMGTLKSLLTAVETSERSWQDALGDIQLALNCTTNRITKATPLEMLIGKQARPLNLINSTEENAVDLSSIRSQALTNIERNAMYEKKHFDKNKKKIVKFNVGDHVLLKAEERHQTKLDPKYRGPFVVSEVLENDRYLLKALTGKRSYKYSHEYLRKLPEGNACDELLSLSEDNSSTSGAEDVETDINLNEN